MLNTSHVPNFYYSPDPTHTQLAVSGTFPSRTDPHNCARMWASFRTLTTILCPSGSRHYGGINSHRALSYAPRVFPHNTRARQDNTHRHRDGAWGDIQLSHQHDNVVFEQSSQAVPQALYVLRRESSLVLLHECLIS